MCAQLTSGEIPVKLGVVSLSVMANVAKSSGMGTQNSVLAVVDRANKTLLYYCCCMTINNQII